MIPDVATQIMAQYWQRVDRLVRAAAHAGMDLAVSSPSIVPNGTPGGYNLVWEHQMLEPGSAPLSRPDQTWHVYRCAGGVRA